MAASRSKVLKPHGKASRKRVSSVRNDSRKDCTDEDFHTVYNASMGQTSAFLTTVLIA